MSENQQLKGLSTTRIETLCDGVFAIALTLLILDIKVPEHSNNEALLPQLIKLWPQIAAYIVSFLVIAVYWIGHHYQFFYIKKADRTLLWLNIFFLMSIAFVPFSTSLLAAYNNDISAVLVYGLNVSFSGLMLYFSWAYASQKNSLVHNLPKEVKKSLGQRILLGLMFYFIAAILGFVSTTLSLVLFALLPFLYMRSSRVIDEHVKSN